MVDKVFLSKLVLFLEAIYQGICFNFTGKVTSQQGGVLYSTFHFNTQGHLLQVLCLFLLQIIDCMYDIVFSFSTI